MHLDLKLTGCRVRTMDPRRPVASSVGIWNGQIVGVDDDLDGLVAKETLDLRGNTVLPGFIDAHTHLIWAGMTERFVNVEGADTVDGVLSLLERATLEADPGAWVDAAGYDQRPLGRHLTRDDLDSIAHGRRVYLRHVSGHVCVVSGSVLDDIPRERIDAAGPGVVRDETGRPTGLLEEAAQSIARDARLPYPIDDVTDALERGARRAASEGVTFCAEAGISGALGGHSPVELTAYQNALEAGRLPVRIQVMVPSELVHDVGAHPADGIATGLDLGMRTGLGDHRLSIGAVKAWFDGGMMARTAALTTPYIDGDNMGDLADDADEIQRLLVAAHVAGWQLAIHAIGDHAVDIALDTVEKAQATRHRHDARHRIEHAGLVRPDQLERMAAANVTAVIQPSFLYFFGDDYARIMGAERSPWMYRGQTFLDHGIPIAGSSDRPVTIGSPLRAIQFMVERRSASGASIGPDEALSIGDALAAYTTGAARACRIDDRLGSVTPGKYADLTILADDPFDVPLDEIASIPVNSTIVGGEVRHRR
jgi:hypothetical protein